VDLYFQTEVAARIIQTAGAHRIVSSLQQMANDIEYIDGSDHFVVESHSVKTALEVHTREYQVRMQNQVTDPHANLPTDLMPDMDFEHVIRTIMETSINLKDLSLAMVTCEQSFLRLDSLRKLCLPQLCCNCTHGPVPNDTQGIGMDKYMLTYILNKRVHKERANSIRVAGVGINFG
jgi:hypothetical protein